MDVSWGQSGRDPQKGTSSSEPDRRGPCWVAQLPHGLGVSGKGKCSSPKAQELDVILTPCALKPGQLSPAQCWFVWELTWEALPCLSSVDFSSLVRLPGTPNILAWLREQTTVAGNSHSSFCLMHLMEITNQYATRLHQLASSCKWGTLAGELIRDQIVLGTADNEGRALMLQQSELEFNHVVDTYCSSEQTQQQPQKSNH